MYGKFAGYYYFALHADNGASDLGKMRPGTNWGSWPRQGGREDFRSRNNYSIS